MCRMVFREFTLETHCPDLLACATLLPRKGVLQSPKWCVFQGLSNSFQKEEFVVWLTPWVWPLAPFPFKKRAPAQLPSAS